MTNASHFTVLIVEPNEKLTHPYNLLPPQYHITRVSTIVEAQQFVTKIIPDILFLSASFSENKSLFLLESLKKQLHSSIPKLIFVIDFNHPLNFIPGTTWADKVDVMSSKTNAQTLYAILM